MTSISMVISEIADKNAGTNSMKKDKKLKDMVA